MIISAIVPCYNAVNTITRAIESLIHQTFAIDEIIVVNDGSSDGSYEVLEAMKDKHDMLVVLHQENKGVAAARNRAIAAANGSYILTLDADDYFEPSFAEKALSKIKESASYGAVMCGYVRVVQGRKTLPYIPPEVSLESCLLDNGVLSCILFKKYILLEAGGYDEAMVAGYEDWDLNIRILKLGYTFAVVPEVLFNYSHLPESRTASATENDVSLRMQMYYKYEEDYKTYAPQHFKTLITQNNRLKFEKEKLRSSTSFKLGHFFTSKAQRTLNLFKKR